MEELLENRRKQNAKNRIPALNDEAFEFSRIEVMGFPLLKLIHKEHADRANLFLIGGGMALIMPLKFLSEMPLRNALTAGWISIGNLWMFGGLLVTMKKAKKKCI